MVTGGAGFVGRELVRQLSDSGEAEIHVLDNLASGEHRLDAMNRRRFGLHVADIRVRDSVRRIMNDVNPDVVFHLAAIHYLPLCEESASTAVGVNVDGTVNLLETIPENARFVFVSTAAVYAPDDDAHVETTSLIGPMEVYGHTKLQGEQFVRHYSDLRGLEAVIVRLFNVVGPGETNPHIVPAIIDQLSNGATDVTLGNLFPHRDYIDVADAAEGLRRIAAAADPDRGVITCNLGTGRTHSVEDVATLIAKTAGVPLTMVRDERRVRAADRPMLKASTARLRELTGWCPGTTLEQSLARAWASRHEDRRG
jgi:UDP-glucose 4-epimerase